MADVDRDHYLLRLATAADEWFARPVDRPRDLADRLIDFRRGCTAILLADQTPLPQPDRQWLQEQCGSWAKSLTDELTELESGKSTAEVRTEAEETIKKLSAALRDRVCPVSQSRRGDAGVAGE